MAASGGAHEVIDVVRAIMCGATTVQLVSTLLRHGPNRLATLKAELIEWIREQEYASSTQMRGVMSARNIPDPTAYARSGYIRLLETWQGEGV